MDHANRGEAALAASNYSEAISHYTSAVQQSPEAATYYLKRSMAYQRNSNYVSALHDAERAVLLAVKRAKRELIAQAQLRRGIALYHLGNYGDADYCFGLAKKLNDKEKSTQMWMDKAQMKMKELDENDAKRKVNVKEMPDVTAVEETRTTDSKVTETSSAPTTKASETTSATTPSAQASSNPTQTSQSAQTPPSKIRHEWYQNTTHVYLTILAKGVPKDLANVTIEPASVSISFPTSTGSTYDFSLDPLYAKVDAAASTSRVLSTKIEVVLKKEVAGQKWNALEGTATHPGENGDKAPADDQVRSAVLSASATTNGATAGVPSPYASRGGAKNWDNIAKTSLRAANAEAQAQAQSSSKDEADSDSEDPKKQMKKKANDSYLDDDDDEGDDVNKFFKHLFKNADPDTRKAMIKSYTESGGTALSTNWDEVSKKRVEISPPDGMEAREWEK